jgi:hypothetical protein
VWDYSLPSAAVPFAVPTWCWHLAFRDQYDVTNHNNNNNNNNRVSFGEFAAHRLFIKAIALQRLLLCEFPSLNTEMRVPSLPGSLDTGRLVNNKC